MIRVNLINAFRQGTAFYPEQMRRAQFSEKAGIFVGRGFNRGEGRAFSFGFPRLLRPGAVNREAPEVQPWNSYANCSAAPHRSVNRLECLTRLLLTAILVASSPAFFQPIQAQTQQATHAKVLGQRLKCMCGGCGDTASSCNHTGGAFSGPCDTAKGMLKEASDRIATGSSDDLVLQSFVQEYGPTVLIEPPKAGFNLLAWIMPVAFPILALIAVWAVVRRWRHRAILAPATGVGISPELLARAHREAEKDSDE
jgi:cytochrome c-type biogenesis protein CcmH/NrfF